MQFGRSSSMQKAVWVWKRTTRRGRLDHGARAARVRSGCIVLPLVPKRHGRATGQKVKSIMIAAQRWQWLAERTRACRPVRRKRMGATAGGGHGWLALRLGGPSLLVWQRMQGSLRSWTRCCCWSVLGVRVGLLDQRALAARRDAMGCAAMRMESRAAEGSWWL